MSDEGVSLLLEEGGTEEVLSVPDKESDGVPRFKLRPILRVPVRTGKHTQSGRGGGEGERREE